MTALKDKIKTALDESRILILGSQVLVGFQYRSMLEPEFEKLGTTTQIIKLASLTLLLLSLACLMSPGAYHRIVHNGEDAVDVHRFTTRVMDVALLPISIAISIDMYVAFALIGGRAGGLIGGLAIGLTAIFFWYGIELWQKLRRRAARKGKSELKDDGASNPTKLKDKIEQVLTETRMVLPGAQALLGFQLTTMLMQGFESLPLSSKYIHLASLALMALSVILLMSPAAFHRIVEDGEDTERVHRFTSGMLLASMVTLPLGIAGDFFVVVKKVVNSNSLAGGSSLLLLAVFFSLWFGYTLYRRHQLQT